MKEIVKTSRLAGSLEKIFRMVNADLFNNELSEPVITIQSTPRAYGSYTLYNAWNVKGEGRREINIGAGTLDRPIELTLTTIIHECCHMYADTVLHVQDTSNRGVYHNKTFKEIAESHLLICTRSEKYGWSDTSTQVSDELIDWILSNNIQEIKLNRNEFTGYFPMGGSSGSSGLSIGTGSKSNSRKYQCPCCRNSVRATKLVHISCLDCHEEMLLAN